MGNRCHQNLASRKIWIAFAVVFAFASSTCQKESHLNVARSAFPPTAVLSISPGTNVLAVGQKLVLTAEVRDNNVSISDVTFVAKWSAKDSSICAITSPDSDKGGAELIAVSKGLCQIEVKLADLFVTFETEVTDAQITSVTIEPASVSVAEGDTTIVKVTAKFSNKTTQDITSLAKLTCISRNCEFTDANAGILKGVSSGSDTIVTQIDGIDDDLQARARVEITDATMLMLAITSGSTPNLAGLRKPFFAIGINSDGTTTDLTETVDWDSEDASIAAVSNNPTEKGTVVANNAGTTTVVARHDDVAGTKPVTVLAATLASISIVAPADSLPINYSMPLNAIGHYSDGRSVDITHDVTWSSGNNTIATVGDTTGSKGLLTGAGLGSTNISATLNAQTGNLPITITAGALDGLTVTPNALTLPVGVKQSLKSQGMFSDGSTVDFTEDAVWISSDTSIATVSNSSSPKGLVSAKEPGTATITATVDGESASTTIIVSSAMLTALTVQPEDEQFPLSQSKQFTAKAVYSDASEFDVTELATWKTDDATTAFFSSAAGKQGLLSALKGGSVTIDVSFGDRSDTTGVTVLGESSELVTLSITPNNPTLALGETVDLVVTGTYADGSEVILTDAVSLTSSASSILAISNSDGTYGQAKGLSNGGATVTAELADVTDSTSVTVDSTPALTQLVITPVSKKLAVGDAVQYQAVGHYSDGSSANLTGTVTWASTDTGIVTITAAGLATAVSQGSASITASDGGDITASTGMTVTALTDIAVTPTEPSVPLGNTQQMTATGTYSDGSTADITNDVTWTIAAGAVRASVNASGLVSTSGSAGAATVQASLDSVTGSTAITITAAEVVSLAISPLTPSIAADETQQFTAVATMTDGTTPNVTASATWTSSDSSRATINSSGLATGVNDGSTTVTVEYGGATAQTALTLIPYLTTIAITPSTPSLALGLTQQMDARGTYSDGSSNVDITGDVTWSSSNTSVATIDGSGLISTVTVGSSVITAALDGVDDSTTLTVNAAEITEIAVTPTSPSITVDDTQQFTATATFTDGSTSNISGSATWASSDGDVATINVSGLATPVSAGTADITASRDGIDSPAITLTVTMPPAPTAPSALTATPASDSEIDLSWTDNSSNETGFEIERSPNGSTSWTLVETVAEDATSYSDTSLTSGTYYYRVRAINGGGNSSFTSVASAATATVYRIFATSTLHNGGFGGLGGGTSICQSKADTAGLGGTWRALVSVTGSSAKDNLDVDGLVFNMRPEGSGGPELIANNVSALWDGSIDVAVRYDENGNTLGFNTTAWTGTKSDGSYGANTCSGFTSQWSSVQGQAGYATNATSQWLEGLVSNCNNQYRLYCIDGQSAIPFKPADGGAVARSTTSLEVWWVDISDNETGFEVERSLDGSTGWANVTTTAADTQSYLDTGLDLSTTYYYRVRAVNAQGETSYTAPVSATTGPSHRIFATSTRYTSDLGGLTGANALCQTQAGNAGLGGNWNAILSVSGSIAADNIEVNGPIYNQRAFAEGGPQLIANNAADLWDGTLQNAIKYHQDGSTTSSMMEHAVWTGSDANGGALAPDCDGFTNKFLTEDAYTGNMTYATDRWITQSVAECTYTIYARLYCIDGQSETPNKPVDGGAVARSTTSIEVWWVDISDNETGFEVERSLDGSTGWTNVTTTAAGAQSYVDTSLSPSTTYYYRARSVNASGASNYTTPVSATTAVTHRIFATSTRYTSDFGGLTGANTLCQTQADNVGLGGTWNAILSVTGSSAADNIEINGAVYNMRAFEKGGPQLIANDSSDMWDGTLQNPIKYHENGSTTTSLMEHAVWTGSDANGGALAPDCDGFTNKNLAEQAYTGNIIYSTDRWITQSTAECTWTVPARLYCIDGQSGAPNKPADGGAVPRSTSSVEIWWGDISDDETGFEVERSLDGSTGWTNITTTAANVESYLDTGLAPSTTYYYRARSVNANGQSNYTAVVSTTTAVSHRIFATSTQYTSDFGGVVGANALCQTQADNVGLGGTWKAILSVSGSNAADNIAVNGAVYNMRAFASGGPQIIANDATDLWDGSLQNPVKYHEDGSTTVSVMEHAVWTGSDANGAALAPDCNGFTSKMLADEAYTGNITYSSVRWITQSTAQCTWTVSARLYCIDGQ